MEGQVWLVVTMLVLPSHTHLLPHTNIPDRQYSASQRFLSLFSVVRFKNEECTGEGGLTGVCYTSADCANGGGNPSGQCANGFGVCCVTRVECGTTTSNNCTYFESPGYPATFNMATTCTHTLTFEQDVCQIRMDVERVELAPPTIQGNCEDDTLTFSQDIKWSSVCGTTVDSHFYHDVDPSASTSLTFTFTTGSTSFNRRWRFKVSQICCDQISMAPSGCGQYFTTATGTIKGWNHDGLYLSGQNYAVCVRKELNTCSTTYLDNQEFVFRPICGDTLELPFPVFIDAPSSNTCDDPFAFLDAMPLTVPLQGPHYFYLVTTTDTSNDHTTASNLHYTYTQNAC